LPLYGAERRAIARSRPDSTFCAFDHTRTRSLDARRSPAPAPPAALLAPVAAGICGSDLEGYRGHQANRTPPLVVGHELAGRVVPSPLRIRGVRLAALVWAVGLFGVLPVVVCTDQFGEPF
jgi:NADPH:quinone reductase-like Zn-dependent oxidoreductase